VKETLAGERQALQWVFDFDFQAAMLSNYLGSGAFGVRPFAFVSYHSRFAPHAMIGFEANGRSVNSGNVVTGVKGQIPNEFDFMPLVRTAYATKWLTGAFDIIGAAVSTPNGSGHLSEFLAPCDNNPTFNTPMRAGELRGHCDRDSTDPSLLMCPCCPWFLQRLSRVRADVVQHYERFNGAEACSR